MSFTARKGRFTKANASRLGKLGAAAKARKRMEGPPPDEPCRVPAGFFLGVLAWHGCDGELHRWAVRQGPRANNIQVTAKGKTTVCGWDHFLRILRKHLSTPKRFYAP
jgi:hypothetical protein